MVLAPGEKAQLSGRTGKLVRSEADTRLYTAMAQGKWFFDKASLGEIAALLHDYYGMNVVFMNERQRSLTMSAVITLTDVDTRSEERCVGKEVVSTGRIGYYP